MTTDDYHVTMKKVGIADLKSRLSEHLRSVRRGQPITVMDRDTPVARILPCEAAATPLVIHRPRRDAPKPGRVPLPAALPVKQDIVRLLLEERQAGP
jgi:prevent-host-death family protein